MAGGTDGSWSVPTGSGALRRSSPDWQGRVVLGRLHTGYRLTATQDTRGSPPKLRPWQARVSVSPPRPGAGSDDFGWAIRTRSDCLKADLAWLSSLVLAVKSPRAAVIGCAPRASARNCSGGRWRSHGMAPRGRRLQSCTHSRRPTQPGCRTSAGGTRARAMISLEKPFEAARQSTPIAGMLPRPDRSDGAWWRADRQSRVQAV